MSDPRALPPGDVHAARQRAFAFYLEALKAAGALSRATPIENQARAVAVAAGVDFAMYLKQPIAERLDMVRQYAAMMAGRVVDRVADAAHDAITDFARSLLEGPPRRRR